MALFPLGILSAAGAGEVGATYELIETAIVSGSSTSSIVFDVSTFASTYKHLQVRSAYFVGTNANLVSMRLNADTGSNYSQHYVEGTGSVVVSAGASNATSMYFGYTQTVLTNAANAVVCDLLDAFSTTKNKTTRTLSGREFISLYSGNWRNTNAVTSVTIVSPNVFIAGSRFSLYGIKG
jgi:hypothetical protein